MSFNMNFSTLKSSSTMSFGPRTIWFSNLPEIRSKQQLQSMMIELQIESQKLLDCIRTSDMFEFNRMLIEVVVQEVL